MLEEFGEVGKPGAAADTGAEEQDELSVGEVLGQPVGFGALRRVEVAPVVVGAARLEGGVVGSAAGDDDDVGGAVRGGGACLVEEGPQRLTTYVGEPAGACPGQRQGDQGPVPVVASSSSGEVGLEGVQGLAQSFS